MPAPGDYAVKQSLDEQLDAIAAQIEAAPKGAAFDLNVEEDDDGQPVKVWVTPKDAPRYPLVPVSRPE